MKTLQQDSQLIQSAAKRTGDVLDMLGPDIDSTLFRSAQYTALTNTFQDISTGNVPQNIGVGSGGSQISIKPQINNSILNLYSIAVGFKYIPATVYSVPINALSLVSPLQFRFDQYTKGYSYGDTLLQQWLELTPYGDISSHRKGLWIGNLEYFDKAFMEDINSGAATVAMYGGKAYTVIAAADQTSTVVAAYQQGYHTAMNSYLFSKAIDGDKNVMIPLRFIYPDLFESMGGCMFVKYAGQIEFQILTNGYIKGIVNILPQTAGGVTVSYIQTAAVPAADYKLVNFYTTYNYNVITDTNVILSNIYNSIIEYHPHYTIPFVAPMSNATQLTFSLAANQNVHDIIFACHPNSAALRQNIAISSSATYYGGNSMAGEDVMFPAFKIQQITLDIGGKIVTLNSQSLAALQLMQPLAGTNGCYDDEQGGYSPSVLWQTLRCPYRLNLKRFFQDRVGSSTGQSTNMIVSIYFDFAEDLSIYGRNINTASGVLVNALVAPANYLVYGFTFVSSRMEMKNGSYYEAK